MGFQDFLDGKEGRGRPPARADHEGKGQPYIPPPTKNEAGWQPMETVPKDGREVLLKVEIRAGIPGKCLVGHYMQGGHCIEDHPPPIDAGWYFWNGCNFDKAAKPMAWMPLPEE